MVTRRDLARKSEQVNRAFEHTMYWARLVLTHGFNNRLTRGKKHSGQQRDAMTFHFFHPDGRRNAFPIRDQRLARK